jgi:hypothetical protein
LTLQPLAVNRPASIESVNKALTTDHMLLLVVQKDDAEADPASSSRWAPSASCGRWRAAITA